MGGRFTAGLLAHSAKAMHVLRSEPEVTHDRQASRGEFSNGIGDSAATFQLHCRGAAFLEEPCRIARGLLGRNLIGEKRHIGHYQRAWLHLGRPRACDESLCPE